MYRALEALQRQLLSRLESGKRCFVPTNSKAFVAELEVIVRGAFDGKKRCLAITSDNSRNANEVEFIKNIQTRILDLDILICSPSLGTGIDITFPGGAVFVDYVAGFFYPHVNTHTDIDQMLCRVRNPGEVNAWIGASSTRYECNIGVVKDDLARSYFVRRAVKGRDPMTGLVQYDAEDPLLSILTHVVAAQRASKNNLYDLFCELRRKNGWQVLENFEEGKKNEHRERAAKEIFNARVTGVLGAPALSDIEFVELSDALRRGAVKGAIDRDTFERNSIEKALGVAISRDLVVLNRDGRLVSRVEALAQVLRAAETFDRIANAVVAEATKPKGRIAVTPDPLHLTVALLRAAGVMDDGKFVANKPLTVQSLREFAMFCIGSKTAIEEVLKRGVRSDVKANPVRQLNELLRSFGLKMRELSKRKVAGKTLRDYVLDEPRLALMLKLATCFERTKEEKERLDAA